MDDFVWRALIAGLGVAAVAGPLGCFIVWRRMAYFGDTVAHSGLLGVVGGLLLEINLTLGVAVVSMVLALTLFGLESRGRLASDTLLGILSHTALAVGLIAASFVVEARLDLMSYLFGDVLSVSRADIAWIYGGGAAALAVLTVLWRPLLAASIDADVAASEGVRVRLVQAGFMLLIAVAVAIAMKIVGILLITALMIIPAAAARSLARTPEQMALIAAGLGMGAVALGLSGSLGFDTPAGPSIVAAAALIFAASLGLERTVVRHDR